MYIRTCIYVYMYMSIYMYIYDLLSLFLYLYGFKVDRSALDNEYGDSFLEDINSSSPSNQQ